MLNTINIRKAVVLCGCRRLTSQPRGAGSAAQSSSRSSGTALSTKSLSKISAKKRHRRHAGMNPDRSHCSEPRRRAAAGPQEGWVQASRFFSQEGAVAVSFVVPVPYPVSCERVVVKFFSQDFAPRGTRWLHDLSSSPSLYVCMYVGR